MSLGILSHFEVMCENMNNHCVRLESDSSNLYKLIEFSIIAIY